MRQLLAAVMMILLSGPALAAGKVALLIGNGGYTTVPKLSNPANDATDMAAAFGRLGFDVTLAKDLGVVEFRRALQDFESKAAGADMAVIYFAGHGIEIGGTNYLIPVNASLLKDTHVEDEAVTLRRVFQSIEGAQGLKLVILDACRNNPFAAQMASRGAKRSIGRGLAAIEPEGGILVAYASRDGTVALDGDGRNSPFAAALLQHIEEPGLEINFLFRRVHDQVFAATGGQQKPYMYGALSRNEIYFKPLEARPEPKAEPAAPDIAALYGKAEQIGTAEAWAAFLAVCKDSPYCGLAEAARAKLAAIPADPAPLASPAPSVPEQTVTPEAAPEPAPRATNPAPKKAKPAKVKPVRRQEAAPVRTTDIEEPGPKSSAQACAVASRDRPSNDRMRLSQSIRVAQNCTKR